MNFSNTLTLSEKDSRENDKGLLFVDISKAFDSLNHKGKLEHLGLSERSLG